MSNNNEKPLISIIVPVYNTSAYLKRCVESLTSQTYSLMSAHPTSFSSSSRG